MKKAKWELSNTTLLVAAAAMMVLFFAVLTVGLEHAANGEAASAALELICLAPAALGLMIGSLLRMVLKHAKT